MRYWFFVIFILVGPLAYAQENPTPIPTSAPGVYQMNEVVVYGEKMGNKLLEGKDLGSLDTDGRLGDLLDNIPSVESQGLGGAKSFSQPSIRGGDANQTVILLNGQRMNQGFDLGTLPTDDIQSVELIKGPGALAYAPDATGGVLNIVTRTQTSSGLLGASYGDFGTYQLRASTGTWKVGPWEGSLGGNWNQTNGYAVNTDQVSGEIDHSSLFHLGQGRLSLTAQYTYRNGGAPNGDSLAAQDIGEFDTDDRGQKQTFAMAIRDEHPMGNWDLDSSFSYNHAYVYRVSPLGADNAAGIPPVDLNNYDTFDGTASASLKESGWFGGMTLGLEFRSEQVQGTEGLDGGARVNNVLSLDAKGTLRLTSELTLNWNGRLDAFNDYNAAVFNPVGTLRYEWEPGLSLYVQAGTGYRRGTFDELFHPNIPFAPGSPQEFGAGETGNPGLSPESSMNWEVGTNLKWKGLTFQADGFADLYTNLITPAQDTTGFWTFVNIPQAALLGAEADLRWEPTPEFSPYGNFLFVDSRDQQTQQLIPDRVRVKFTAGVRSEVAPGVDWDIHTQYVEHNPVLYQGDYDEEPPLITTLSYWIWNTGIRAQVDQNLKLFLNGTNLFNQAYATLQGLPMPGRYVEAGTTWTF
jgi:vitamin B12 transporter